MFTRLGALVSHHPLLVILSWVALAVGVHYVAPDWDDVTQDGNLHYLPPEMTSVRGRALLEEAFPDAKAKSQLVIAVERPDGPLSDQDFAAVDALAARFDPENPRQRERMRLVDVWTRHSEIVGSKLTSRLGPSGQATLVILLLAREFMETQNIEVLADVRQEIERFRTSTEIPVGLRFGVSGSAAVGGDMLSSAKQSIRNTETTTILLVVLILLAVYRAPLLMIIPLATIFVSVAVSTGVVAWLTQAASEVSWLSYKTAKTTRIFIIVILFGAGTDYCLFLISRYREELTRGLDPRRGTLQALLGVGDALVASALTTILGLATMYFAAFGKFAYAGPTIALCLSITLLACLTLAPALLRIAGRFVFWPFGIDSPAVADDNQRPNLWRFNVEAMNHRLWQRVADAILARPGWVLLCGATLMAYPAWEGLSVPMSYNLLRDLQESRPSVRGTNMLARHFELGEISPVTVVVKQDSGQFDTDEGEKKVARLTKLLYDLDGVSAVRSYAEPLGDPPGYLNPFRRRGQEKIAAKRHPRTKALYLSQVPEFRGKVTRLDLVLDSDPFSAQSVSRLDRIDRLLLSLANHPRSPWYQAEFEFTGTTAGIRDLQQVVQSDQTLIQRLVVITVFAVLVVILRRPLICGYLILTVVASYLVTIGITKIAFAHYFGPSFDGLDWKVPIFLFVILVAVGEDYNIYLVTRVFEEQRRHGPLSGLRRALVRTGGIITSCGFIMAGTFCSMMSGTLREMLELGFALSLGVLLDTLFVRSVLVPAFLAWRIDREHPRPEAPAPHPAASGLSPNPERRPSTLSESH